MNLTCFMLLAALASTPVMAAPDEIVIRGPLQIRGEVLLADLQRVVIRAKGPDGKWVTSSFPRSKVVRINPEPGDQSDGVRTIPEPDGAATPAEGQSVSAGAKPAGSPPANPEGVDFRETSAIPEGAIVVIPVLGPIMRPTAQNRVGCVSARCLVEALDGAARRKPLAVVLDIDGTGGDASETEQVLQHLVDLQRSNLRLVAWPRRAFGGSAEIALACRTMITRKDTEIGGTSPDGSGGLDRALSERLHSQVAEITARPPCVAAVVRGGGGGLWWNPKDGFSCTPKGGEGWREIRAPGERATRPFGSEELSRCHISRALAPDARRVAESIPGAKSPQVFGLEVKPDEQRLAELKAEGERARAEQEAQREVELAERAERAAEAQRKAFERFQNDCVKFKKELERQHETLVKIQTLFPGPDPGGDARNPEWSEWALRAASFKRFQSDAVQCVSICANLAPTRPGPRPEGIAADDWKKFTDLLAENKRMLTEARSSVGNELLWLQLGAKPGIEALSESHRFVSDLLSPP